MSMILVNCPKCATPMQVLPRACSIRCTICQFITHVDQYCFPPPPTPPPPHASSYHNQLHVSMSPPPSPYGQMPAGQPAGIRSKKRAVVCGVLYRNSERELKGSVNDAKSMKGMLQRRFNFPESSIRMLTEEESSSYKPTKENIRSALRWLVEGYEAGDSLVFYFSGHGHQQRNYSGDEIDGSDETLCPMDFENKGMIVDDEINRTIVGPLLPGVKLHAIFDACHSGTMLDLPFLCRMNRNKDYEWEDHRLPSGEWKGTKGGEAFSFSGCDDHQIAIDTRVSNQCIGSMEDRHGGCNDLVFYSRDRPRTCNYVRHLVRFNKVDHE